jgi:hypothetical protein
MMRRLYRNFDPVSIRVKDNTFIIPIPGGAGMTDDPMTIRFQLPGQSVDLLSGSDGKSHMGIPCHPTACPGGINFGHLHKFKSRSAYKGQKIGLEMRYWIRVLLSSAGGKIIFVKYFLNFQLVCPDGDVFDVHSPPRSGNLPVNHPIQIAD